MPVDEMFDILPQDAYCMANGSTIMRRKISRGKSNICGGKEVINCTGERVSIIAF